MPPAFLFDFASPNAYLVWRVLPGIEARTGVTFDHRPVLLGGLFKLTGNSAPMVAFAGIPNKLAYEMLEMRRFIARHGLSEFAMNPHFPMNSLLLMRAAVAADAAGQLKPYCAAIYPAMWERSLKMDDPAVATSVLTDAGLDAQALFAAATTDAVKAKLAANTQAAADAGAFGIPSFLVGDQLYFGKDRLADVEAALAR
ncbi:2-hydroxychromene-2-carboxylate isomerase [Sandaracinobacteroides saxicola]|uniref:2-hydroxychromene-2-carboxylate isomerase n=1 Tax=Sandaracinobacteroides saxicola TaxID=2759707 RepID=A0A7G5IF96_9SPHN|nr:2-hydroxychromene-2-carboxylate isomerase [Sandaracinobacteroides saxicola]QMW22038.1 2-hydroxychromene-2-carboxylate isomerase [Sandaracinobacteroides saxicola]